MLAASCVPTILFLVLCVTIIVLCCLRINSRHKRTEIEHEKDKLDQLKEIIDSLKGEVPQKYFPEFLRFSEQILTTYCSTCPRSSPTSRGVGVGVVMRGEEVRLNLGGMEHTDGGNSEDSDADSVEFKEEQGSAQDKDADATIDVPVPKQVLRAVTNTVRVGLTHPHIGRRLHRQLSAMLTDATTPTTATTSGNWGHGKPDQDALINMKDGGYNSRSNSGSSVPDN